MLRGKELVPLSHPDYKNAMQQELERQIEQERERLIDEEIKKARQEIERLERQKTEHQQREKTMQEETKQTRQEDIENENQQTRSSNRLRGKVKLVLVDSQVSESDDDDDFEHREDSCEERLDDIVFDENVDLNAEWVGTKFIGYENTSSGSSIDDDANSENESGFESVESDEDDGDIGKEARVVFGASSSKNPEFELGQIFPTKQLFKDAVNTYSVLIGRPTRFVKNDTRRIYARCKKKDEGCDWHINALKVKNEDEFQIREMDLVHICARVYQVDNANSRWLANRFEKTFRCDPTKSIKGFRNSVTSELGISVSPYQAYRAKQRALQIIQGNNTSQYSKLWDYADTLRDKNPGSTVILQVDESPSGKRFKRIYICLAATKNGFRSGCRPWIGVDGCHLKGQATGVLLTAVGMDPNNDPYPIAYAVVGVENKETWEWFLQLLKEDLLLEREDLYTFMSDRQKGLIGAFEKILSGVENRFCVRHLHGNMKRAGFKGDIFKKLLWKAANATTVASFNRSMVEIEHNDKRCLEWLQKNKSPKEWSKSHFSTFGKCDTLVNNMCEQFNKCLLDARDKPIITMLEWIREYLMCRLQKKRDAAKKKWEGRKICGKIRTRVGKILEMAGDCIPLKSSDFNYEVTSFDGSRFKVNLENHTCDCRRWELSGIPCKHAVSAICARGDDPENYVHVCYSVETYNSVYEHAIMPMNGEELWSKTGYIPPLPPAFGRKKAGRPTKKRKIGEDEEVKKKSGLQKMPKQNYKVICQFCKEKGHNRSGCQMRMAVEDFMQKDDEEEANKEQSAKRNNGAGDDDIFDVLPWIEDVDLEVEEMTQQSDYPMCTQEDDIDIEPTCKKKPTTRQGRQKLQTVKKTTGIDNNNGQGDVTGERSPPYSISNSANAPQLVKVGVQIRAPPPMAFHPHNFIGGPTPCTSSGPMKVFTEGGKKFVTLSRLQDVVGGKKKKQV